MNDVQHERDYKASGNRNRAHNLVERKKRVKRNQEASLTMQLTPMEEADGMQHTSRLARYGFLVSLKKTVPVRLVGTGPTRARSDRPSYFECRPQRWHQAITIIHSAIHSEEPLQSFKNELQELRRIRRRLCTSFFEC